MPDYQAELTVAKDIAQKAGAIMLEYFDGDQQKQIKQDGTPLTIADTTINTMVIAELAKAFPGDIVIGEEESTGEYGMGRRWLCDPIDGTRAFTWGTPTAMFSLGLVVNGTPTVGVAYDPFLRRMYAAIKGGDAFCNDTPLHVNNDTLQNGILAVGSSPKGIQSLPYVHDIIARNIECAVFSGAVYKCALIAKGRIAGYLATKVNAYDMAAMHVIIEEAGGLVRGYDGKPYDYTKPFRGTIVANNAQTLAELVALPK